MKLKTSRVIIRSILLTLDILSVCAALFLAYNTRFFTPFTNIFPVTKGIPAAQFYLSALVFIIPLLLFVLHQNGLYKIYFIPFLDELVRVVKAVTTGIFFLVLTTFFYREVSYSRLTFLLFWLFLIVLILLFREMFKSTARLLLRSILKRENILIVGQGNKMLKAVLKKHPHLQVLFFPEAEIENIDKIKNMIDEKDINQVIFVQHNWFSCATGKL
jgi:FlaA1/EpsC-like NDP-sugar epimerase